MSENFVVGFMDRAVAGVAGDAHSWASLPPLDDLLQVGADSKLVHHEHDAFEWKRRFNWANKAEYARTCAALANCRGGYLVFGIDDDTAEIVGIEDASSFHRTDPATISQYLDGTFAPAIPIRSFRHPVGDRVVGVFAVAESVHKPLIATRTENGVFIEGDVHYRYNGRTQRIRPAEMQGIIDAVRRSESDRWLELMTQIAHAGAKNAAILDFSKTGVSAPEGPVLLDERSIERLKFINEKQVVEGIDGVPVVRIQANAQIIRPQLVIQGPAVKELVAIRTLDVILNALRERPVEDPKKYIEQTFYESSGNLPIYYYMRVGNLRKRDVIELAEKCKTRAQGKRTVLKRLRRPDKALRPVLVPTATPTPAMCAAVGAIRDGTALPTATSPAEIREVTRAIFSLVRTDGITPTVIDAACQHIETYLCSGRPEIDYDLRGLGAHIDALRDAKNVAE